eukprot:2499435-Prymnesium_polylepis.1
MTVTTGSKSERMDRGASNSGRTAPTMIFRAISTNSPLPRATPRVPQSRRGRTRADVAVGAAAPTPSTALPPPAAVAAEA